MSRYTAFVVCAASVLSLASCVTAYAPPTSGPTAKIRFQANTDSQSVLPRVRPDGSQCQSLPMIGKEDKWVKKSAAETSSLNMLGASAAPDTRRIERLFAAEKPLKLQLQGIGGKTCNVTFVFTPEANGQYEVLYDTSSEKCYATVNKLTAGTNGEIKRTPIEIQQVGSRLCS